MVYLGVVHLTLFVLLLESHARHSAEEKEEEGAQEGRLAWWWDEQLCSVVPSSHADPDR